MAALEGETITVLIIAIPGSVSIRPADPSIRASRLACDWAAGGFGRCRVMQFNLVVSTKTAGLPCGQENRFELVGALPAGFLHHQLGSGEVQREGGWEGGLPRRER